ncbi:MULTISPECIES: T9SS type B sorting domain-containing protein [unclassified Kaistella]|uniref:T9SS type B sorting domain-containing protein n=1 Tax=unclassified Kaistella TaxID=2762626 RepID=UPI002735A17C|nr:MULTISPECIES: T9SS type B sorting domain-containing protein [unclassified Kaistella]MDP2453745.1 T9SS type B sorting domain-containing protein [Kaistella sp. SH11-4b]MDP2456802.1 T9SS type B sorting domain-containing protein [Kaistella sp. SH40-3]MDP2459558.1 T9SS type B sorting domain-containing protein [Kaistella sp. SH19-2b]
MQRRVIFLVFAFLTFNFPLFGQNFCNAVKITDNLGNEDPIIDCSYPLQGNCLNLTANYPTFFETNSYEVSSENFTPYSDFNSGTPLNANADDLFFDKIKIPFNFCYFGKNYNEVIVGSNGVLTFDSSQLGKVNYPNVEELNPSIALPKNSVFGVFSDLVFSKDDDSEVYYSIIGTAPCRKLVVNFYKGRVLGCAQTVTSQIVLSEGSNIVEIFVENKPLLCPEAKFKNSLIGIINSESTVGYSPASRNSGIWEAQNEAWKFAPSGNAITPQISWFNATNQMVGSRNTINVCPTKNEIFTVKVSYPVCGNFNYILEDTSAVTFASDFPLAKNFTKIFCGDTTFNVNLEDYKTDLTPQNPNNLNFTFHNSLSDAQNGINPQPINFILNSNRIFHVRVQNQSDPNCFRIAVLNLNLISQSLLTSTLDICDINNDGVENNYQLSLFNNRLFTSPINGSIHYFLSQADADNNTNEITTANLVNNAKLYVSYKTSTCSQTFGPVTIRFRPAPSVSSPIDYIFTTCDYLGDLTEVFAFNDILGPLVTSDPSLILIFYETYDQAYSGSGSPLTTIREGRYQVFARVEVPGGCFSIATINLDITFTKIEAKDDTVYLCFNGVDDINVNLNDYAPEMLLQLPVGITTSYFLSVEDAEADTNPISNLQTITEDGNFISKTFYVKFSDATDCYAVKALTINLVHVIISQSQFNICDFNNDGQENVVLSTLSNRIVSAQNATVSYFTNLTDAENNTNAITQFEIQNTAKLFARIQSYSCFAVFEIDLNLVSTPIIKTVVSVVLDSVCDNNNDGFEPVDLTNFQAEIYTGVDSVNFEYYTGYNSNNNSLTGLISNPNEFVIPKNSIVYVKVALAGGCYSVSTLNIQLNFLPVIILKSAALKKCDYDFNLNESFDLNEALPQLFAQSENTYSLGDIAITYYETQNAANAGIASTQIFSPVVTIISKKIVWARFTSKTIGCYSIAPIELQTYLPPKAMNSVIANICDDNLDGLYDVDLTSFTDYMVYTQSADNNFSFFLSKMEADTNKNPIVNPEKYSFDPSITKVWVRVENIPGCFDTAVIDFNLGTTITFDNKGPFLINECDSGNDSVENINLTQFEKNIYMGNATFEYYPTFLDLNNGTNKISTPASYLFNENSGSQKIFVKVNTTGFCPGFVEINLKLKKTPMFTLPIYYFCPDGFVDVKPDLSNLNLVSYEWKNPAGEIVSTTKELKAVKTAGIYTLKVTAANNCTFTTEVHVKMYEVPIITKLLPSGNSYTVIATGSKKILYSIDGVNYQETNTFYNLPYGVVTFYVKFEGSDCLGVIKKGLVLNIKNAFTPNDDGINDTWIIDDLNVFDGEKANIKVFNRFKEKIFEQESATRLEWNGKTLSRVVPTDSYWYVLTLADGRVFTGWVLVKNRN